MMMSQWDSTKRHELIVEARGLLNSIEQQGARGNDDIALRDLEQLGGLLLTWLIKEEYWKELSVE